MIQDEAQNESEQFNNSNCKIVPFVPEWQMVFEQISSLQLEKSQFSGRRGNQSYQMHC